MKILSTRRTTNKKTQSTTSRKKTSTKKSQARETASRQNTRRQLWALILFGASLILGVLTFLEGENFWAFLHKGFFGLFGIAAYLVAPLALIISILLGVRDTPLCPKYSVISEYIFVVI